MATDQARRAARLRTVEEHVAFENRRDLDGLMTTFGALPCYEDTPWGEHHEGRTAVRDYYHALMTAAPDLHIETGKRHVTEETVVLECTISGTHQGPWRGLPPTGRRLSFPVCAVYTFDDDDRLQGERIYYDRCAVLRQLGVLHEPDTALGRVTTALTHPITLGRAAIRQLHAGLTAARGG